MQPYNSDNCIKSTDSQLEKYFHDILQEDKDIRNDLYSIMGYSRESGEPYLIHEDQYINGITADFTMVFGDTIYAIIECKAGDIGVTDFVRGIGQVLQYEYFFEKDISNKGLKYASKEQFRTILLIPSSVFKNNNFNIGKFKYPHTTEIVEINENSKAVRLITSKELDKLSTLKENSLISISQYYIRDNRLFELYILLKYLIFLKSKGEVTLSRVELEEELKTIEVINNGNWRNAFISLSSLGLINSKNLPTHAGWNIGNYDYESYLNIMYKSYLMPYISLLSDYFYSNKLNLLKSNQDICSDLKNYYDGKDILFLTESNGRYLSSWLNILRDDFGMLNFKARSSTRTLNYNINHLNEKVLREYIHKYTKAFPYIENIKKILK